MFWLIFLLLRYSPHYRSRVWWSDTWQDRATEQRGERASLGGTTKQLSPRLADIYTAPVSFSSCHFLCPFTLSSLFGVLICWTAKCFIGCLPWFSLQRSSVFLHLSKCQSFIPHFGRSFSSPLSIRFFLIQSTLWLFSALGKDRYCEKFVWFKVYFLRRCQRKCCINQNNTALPLLYLLLCTVTKLVNWRLLHFSLLYNTWIQLIGYSSYTQIRHVYC